VMLFVLTMMLDLVAGKMNNVSSCELLRIIVNFIVVFSGLSVGLRSGNAVGAIQTLAGKIVAK
jgi:thiamine transporter ThiT